MCWHLGLPSALGEESRCSSSAVPCFFCPFLLKLHRWMGEYPHPQAHSYPMPEAAQTVVQRVCLAKRPTQVLLFHLGYFCCLSNLTNNPDPEIQTQQLRRRALGSMLSLLHGSVCISLLPAPFSEKCSPMARCPNSCQFSFPGLDRSWLQMASCHSLSPCWQFLPL